MFINLNDSIMKRKIMYTSIPSELYEHLLKLNMSEPLLNLDIAFGVIGLIYRKQLIETKTKTYNGLNSFINMDCRLLKLYDLNGERATTQLKLLEKLRVINISPERFNVNDGNGKARGYKIILDFDHGNLKQIPLPEKVSKRTYNKHIKRAINADYTTEHLTKWMDNKYFIIDKEKALKYIDKVYTSKDKISKNRKARRIYSIKNFESQLKIYSREGKDNRLHSCFTNLPTDLKQFVLCNGKSLVELDIKSSQPFVLSVILEIILKSYKQVTSLKDQRKSRMIKALNNRIKKRLTILKYTSLNDYDIKLDMIIDRVSTILLNDSECIDFVEISNFISDIRVGDLYDKVGTELLQRQVIIYTNTFYQVNLYDTNTNCCKDFKFKNLRECAKHIVLNSIYANYKNPKKVVREFRNLYPSTMKILDQFKAENYKDLAILMQRIESSAILDYSSKKIAQKLPNTPLVTRHDSLSTTSDMISNVSELFVSALDNFFNCSVPVIQRAW